MAENGGNWRQHGDEAMHSSARPYALARWLWVVAFMVFAMIVVGGITRLTESGLSITEWKPVSGTIPPLNEADWQQQFDLYKQTTQYQTVNQQMTLADFKFIFFWEWVHRLLGRLIGLAFALPLAWFAWKRAIPAGYGPRLIGLLVLGGLQGVIGWWMVTSGLVGRTEVSHYRLAVHLMMAFLILGALVWTAFDLGERDAKGLPPARLTGFGLWALVVLGVQLVWGAFTAGLRAGRVTNDWPKMGADWFPADVGYLEPQWRNIMDNPFVVHFFHRWWAWIVALTLWSLARRLRRLGDNRVANGLLGVVAIQILLGIWTVMSSVNLHVAVTHQAIAALLVIVAAGAVHRLDSAVVS